MGMHPFDLRKGTLQPSFTPEISLTEMDVSLTSEHVHAVLASVCSNATVDCSFHLYTAFSGSDKYGATFSSNFQLTRVNEYSITNLYDKSTATVR